MVEELTCDDDLYDEWVASRRTVEPSHDLADQVMAALKDLAEVRPEREHILRLADRMNELHPARLAACLAVLIFDCRVSRP